GKLPPTKNNKTNSLLEFASRLFFVIKKSGQIPAYLVNTAPRKPFTKIINAFSDSLCFGWGEVIRTPE
ncbi:MAG: hypothetical protein IJY63_03720, partial [Clostridia bacterium]|nr:hypothetical protein [Clostridia bacterium]